MKYIDADKLIAEIERLKSVLADPLCSQGNILGPDWVAGGNKMLKEISTIITSLQQKQPEPYFYCKYGGTIPLCSDCKRNHNNSSFKTEEIATWYAPSNGTKYCIDYIQQEQPEVDLDADIKMEWDSFKKHLTEYDNDPEEVIWLNWYNFNDIARYFHYLGLITRKEE